MLGFVFFVILNLVLSHNANKQFNILFKIKILFNTNIKNKDNIF